ncbi:MAG: hypothetical protein KBT47_08165, partial [Armatimonadetes bacterium]|nr:hypothetical protein [Candidatus Hippobium faecium]
MKKYLLIIVSVLIGISLLAGCGGGSGSSSSSENASVKITVTKNSIPLKNNKITLNGAKKSYTETTDSQGLAEFEKIYEGTYTIHIEGCEKTFSLNAVKDRTTSVSIDTERENKEYTVIFYANSYNLDGGLTKNLKQMYQFGSTAKTNICVLYKTSQSKGIYRGLVNKSDGSDITEGLEKLPNANFGKPGLMRDFIVWSQTNYPAEKYILVLWDHGTGWTPYWDTKAINHDDDYKDWLECYEIHEAVTGLGLTAICMDACCMQMAEVLT